VVTYGRRNFDNAKTYFTPIVEFKQEKCNADTIKQFCEKWTAPFVSNVIREMVKRWVENGEGLDPKIIERLLMWAGPTSY
jgi:hypothetical protein